ncbi:hypothetical protein [Aquisphaera insulae]|uniref:hypothetical protein n=1 Tax=Aquisphaera insulae TaxID=2712864 RepID=UPI0013EAB942|nr:hypothetical protein [Aquisphaera insulae]
MPTHGAINHAGQGRGRICFRGDIGDEALNRDPEVLFRRGFRSKAPQAEITSPKTGYMAVYIAKRHAPYYNQMDLSRQVVYTKAEALRKYGNLNIATAEGVKDLKQIYSEDCHVALLPTVTDIESPSAVCVTPRFSMAILFPPKLSRYSVNCPPETWVYALYVRNYHDTHTRQSLEGLEAIRRLYAAHAAIRQNEIIYKKSPADNPQIIETYVENSGLWPLYAQELATKEVAAEDVICAVKVHREWGDHDWTHGCSYNIWKQTLVTNENCTVDPSIIQAVEKFIREEPKTGHTPSRSSGFYNDTDEGRMSVDLGNEAEGRRLGTFQ